MSSILSGLKDLGLGNLEKKDIFEEKTKTPVVKKEAAQPEPKKEQTDEREYVFGKTHTCPVCYKDFKAPTVRQSKIRPAGMDKDLRPRFKNFDPMKYDVILCPHCGYAALGRFFHNITPPQAKLVREGISRNFHRLPEKEVFTYDEAFIRYQLALGNAVVKKARASEKAYLCLKMAWIIRSKKEAIEAGTEEVEKAKYLQTMEELEQDEEELLNNAVEGFLNARQTETFPMCGMDEVTLDYIICVSAMKLKKYDLVNQMLNILLVRSGLNSKLRDNCIEIKEELRRIKNEEA
ncbi:MAG: DUF2225 domain-containing protein [Lachnospiraceae bacterium]|nr:DUF2225 domain-containing protein [Lachnospiraceae bacterium]